MASSLVIPTFATPLFNALLRRLEKTVDESIIGSLGGLCLYGDLQNKPPAVSAAQPDHNPTTPYDMSMRVECLLSKTNEQHELHIARLVQRGDARLRHGHCLILATRT